MTTLQGAVAIGTMLLITTIFWLFRRMRRGTSHAKLGKSGYQEAKIRVNGGYAPNSIVVKSGKPVRLVFVRDDKTSCSELILFPDFQKSIVLPYQKAVTVDLFPPHAGTYPFSCHMGLYKGALIVR